jgi:peptide/nickel transport system permease protein
MGTNTLGADILSHMIHACRIAMAIGVISTGLSMVIGVIIGGLMGYFSGIVDLLGSRLVEIFSAIPTIYLLLTFIAAFPEYRSIYLIMAIIGLTSWTGDARFVRAEFLKLRKQDFVHAAIAAGLPLRSVLFRHLLPNALAPLLVSASFGVAGAILAESTLSFLGLGIPIGDASWGQLLNEAISAGGGFNWWLATFPGVAIFFTVFAYNMIGEAVRDALDPRTRGT